ncbi:MAG TPA: dockerin type I domain-containing protein [Pseudobacteroides sp.]|uniref:dockerin type I domain-containing protein n=1 Tax=Pseudobacteroides sp. TaxID=1968840 RepID=UPI002F91FA35
MSKGVDINGDKVINMTDVIILASVLNIAKGNSEYVEAYDLNSDGAINMSDLVIIAAKFNTMVSD